MRPCKRCFKIIRVEGHVNNTALMEGIRIDRRDMVGTIGLRGKSNGTSVKVGPVR